MVADTILIWGLLTPEAECELVVDAVPWQTKHLLAAGVAGKWVPWLPTN
jgi:hypothetical protein